METITLQPGVWTEVRASAFQVRERKAVRFNNHGVSVTVDNEEHTVAPDIDTTDYFTTQSYDPRIVRFTDYSLFGGRITAFLMPDGDSTVDVVIG